MIEKEQHNKIVYSDGESIEAEILNIAKNYKEEDIPDVLAEDGRYLINNTFSRVRWNLLDWYPFKKNCTILEVGAGMGSLTSMLCRKAKHVTSVEMSEARAQVIRERNKGTENLTICSENILSFDTEELFDYVVMVGVLEYAGIFSDSDSPFVDFLAKLKSLMKPDGVLLFAIENQFGLKYWIGASEEHLQKPFVGIQGYPNPKTAKTFSKVALEKMCETIHLNTRFYYLLPDYKFPTAIFTDESLPTYHDVINPRYAYAINSCLTADERTLYRDIIQNNVFPFFANAYLVEASAVLPENHVIRVSGRSEVVPGNRIITTIDNRGNVRKTAQTKEAIRHIHNTYANEQALTKRGVSCIQTTMEGDSLYYKYCTDPMANEVFSKALATGDYLTVQRLIDAMHEALLQSSEICNPADCHTEAAALGCIRDDVILKHGYMDMTFYNAFWKNNTLTFFDQEWDFQGLPLHFLLYYGLKIGYSRADTTPTIPFSWIREYIHVSEDLAYRYDQLEERLWQGGMLREGDIYGADGYYNQYNTATFSEIAEKLQEIQQSLVNKEAHIAQLIESERNLQSDIKCKDGHIEQLLQSERDLLAENAKKSEQIKKLQFDLGYQTSVADNLRRSEAELRKELGDAYREINRLQYELGNRT